MFKKHMCSSNHFVFSEDCSGSLFSVTLPSFFVCEKESYINSNYRNGYTLEIPNLENFRAIWLIEHAPDRLCDVVAGTSPCFKTSRNIAQR